MTHEVGMQREAFGCLSLFLSCYCADFFPSMGRCILLDDAISTLTGLLSGLGMTFEDFTGVVVAAIGCRCLTSRTDKRSPVRTAPG